MQKCNTLDIPVYFDRKQKINYRCLKISHPSPESWIKVTRKLWLVFPRKQQKLWYKTHLAVFVIWRCIAPKVIHDIHRFVGGRGSTGRRLWCKRCWMNTRSLISLYNSRRKPCQSLQITQRESLVVCLMFVKGVVIGRARKRTRSVRERRNKWINA